MTSMNLSELGEFLRQIIRSEMNIKKEDESHDRLLSISDVCQRLDITPPTLLSWRKQGVINDYRIGSRVYFKESEIQAALGTVKKFQVNYSLN